jgi:hypothetical protein
MGREDGSGIGGARKGRRKGKGRNGKEVGGMHAARCYADINFEVFGCCLHAHVCHDRRPFKAIETPF